MALYCTVAAIASQSTPTANKRFSTGGTPYSPQESPELSPRLRRASTLKLPIKISTDPSFSSRSSAAARSRTRSLTAISPEDNPIRQQQQQQQQFPTPPPALLESPLLSGTAPETPFTDNTSSSNRPTAPSSRPAPPTPTQQQQQQLPARQEAASTARAPSRQATSTIPTSTPERKSSASSTRQQAPSRAPSRPVSPEVPRATPSRSRVEETKPASARQIQDQQQQTQQPQQRVAPAPTMSSPAKNPQLAMDTAQAYTQGNTQAGNRGPIANLPLPNLSGQANGVIGNLLKGPVGADGKLKDAALMVGIKLDLEAEVHLTARVRGDILVGLY
ncbi:hypothetical protein SAPIO_CDS6282 [Scedosporium apiospermum]|uniref:Uncharacterized protein n=1 Tax=Pseudallescheria apiosperma TaxID=563466 RepID=A0A084G4E5_PSEDA|nr:uncharacterized protein SAPIO_CDS6282 [Scedosporium apiospermum]KEZ42207.1 hypothetical protein SAPIO_CDS6282 [Scedosporium apiospermum]